MLKEFRACKHIVCQNHLEGFCWWNAPYHFNFLTGSVFGLFRTRFKTTIAKHKNMLSQLWDDQRLELELLQDRACRPLYASSEQDVERMPSLQPLRLKDDVMTKTRELPCRWMSVPDRKSTSLLLCADDDDVDSSYALETASTIHYGDKIPRKPSSRSGVSLLQQCRRKGNTVLPLTDTLPRKPERTSSLRQIAQSAGSCVRQPLLVDCAQSGRSRRLGSNSAAA